MNDASKHVDPVSDLVKKRIALEAVYEIEGLVGLLVEYFVSNEVQDVAFRGIALRAIALNEVLMPILSDHPESGEDMAVAVFGPHRFWPEWLTSKVDPK